MNELCGRLLSFHHLHLAGVHGEYVSIYVDEANEHHALLNN